MKCLSCHAEWTSPVNESLSKCPFCHTDLLSTLSPSKSRGKPEDILRNLFQIYGYELLQQEQRLSAMIADLFAHDKRTQKMLLLSVKEKVPQRMFAITHVNDRETRLNAIQLHLIEDAFLNEDSAKQMIALWSGVFSRSNFVQIKTSKPSPIVLGQESDESLKIICEHGKYGFQNSKGEILIPCKYDKVEAFCKSLAMVCLNGKHGYVDKTGNEIIPLKYDRIGSLMWSTSDDDLLSVELNKKCGFINKNGIIVIPLKYDTIGPKPDYWFYWKTCFRKDDLKIVGLEVVVKKNDGINRSNKARYYRRNSEFRDGDEYHMKYGLINKMGQEVVPLIYDQINEFHEGLACVQKTIVTQEPRLVSIFEKNPVHFQNEENLKWGYINEKGRIVITIKYDFAENFCDGIAKVKLNDKLGYIDKTGNVVIPIKYSYIDKFEEGLARVEYLGKWGFIDRTGNEVIPIKYDSVSFFRAGLALAKMNDRHDYIDKFGNWVKDAN